MSDLKKRFISADDVLDALGKNYIRNAGAAQDTRHWSVYQDAAQDTPVDGEGGTSILTLSRTIDPEEVLSSKASFKLSKPFQNAQGNGVGTLFEIDNADKNKELLIRFDYYDTGMPVGILGVFIYDVENEALIPFQDTATLTASADITSFRGVFTASGSAQYRLLLHCQTTQTESFDLFFDTVSCTRNISLTGSNVQTDTENVFEELQTYDKGIALKELEETPTAPQAGYKKLYVKEDGKVYTLDSDAVEEEIGSGAGGSGLGGKNLFIDPLYNENVDNIRYYKEHSFLNDGNGGFVVGGVSTRVVWTAHGLSEFQRIVYYSNGNTLSGGVLTPGLECYAEVPTANDFAMWPEPNYQGNVFYFSDSSGVGSTHYFRAYLDNPIHLSASVETTAPMANEGSLRIDYTYDGDSGAGEGIELLTKTIDREDRGKRHYYKVSKTLSANYPDNNLVVKVFDKTNGREIYLSNNKIERYKDVLVAIDIPDNCAEISFSLHLETDTASDDWNAIFGIHHLSPDSVVPGFIGSNTKLDHVPVWTGVGTPTLNKFRYARHGEYIIFDGRLATGTVTGDPITFTLPGGMSIDPVRDDSNNLTSFFVGEGSSGSTTNPDFSILWSSATSQNILSLFQSQSGLSGFSALNGTEIGSSIVVVFQGKVKIQGWDSGAVFSTTEIVNKGTNVTATSSSKSVTNSARIDNLTEVDDALGEFSSSAFIPRESGKYDIDLSGYFAANATGVRQLEVWDNTSSSSVTFENKNAVAGGPTTSVRLKTSVNLVAGRTYYFYAYQNSGGALNLNGIRLSITRHVDLKKWAEYTSGGLYPATGWNSGGTVSFTIPGAEFGDLTSVTLPPGEYDYNANAIFSSTGATTMVNVGIGVSSTPGNNSAGMAEGVNLFYTNKATGAGYRDSVNFSYRGLVLTEQTTVYLKGYSANPNTNLTIGWSWRFRKVK